MKGLFGVYRPESAPLVIGTAAMTGHIEQTPSPMPSPLQNRLAAQPTSPGASPGMDRAQRAATLGPKGQVRHRIVLFCPRSHFLMFYCILLTKTVVNDTFMHE